MIVCDSTPGCVHYECRRRDAWHWQRWGGNMSYDQVLFRDSADVAIAASRGDQWFAISNYGGNAPPIQCASLEDALALVDTLNELKSFPEGWK